MFDNMDEFFARAERHKEDLENVMSKLRIDPCMDVPAVGDLVVICAGPLGMGHNWIRLEAEVLHVGNNSYKVRIRDRYGKDKHYEEWIDPVSEQFSFVEHPATCGHCGKEVTVPMCPYCLHEEKSIHVHLKDARKLARQLFAICFRAMGQFDRQGILSDNPWLNKENDDNE